MSQPLRRILTGLWLALWLMVGAVSAQEEPVQAIDRWENVATRAETVVDDATTSDTVLETLRGRIVDFRAVFDTERNANSARIATLREQIAALGDKPAPILTNS